MTDRPTFNKYSDFNWICNADKAYHGRVVKRLNRYFSPKRSYSISRDCSWLRSPKCSRSWCVIHCHDDRSDRCSRLCANIRHPTGSLNIGFPPTQSSVSIPWLTLWGWTKQVFLRISCFKHDPSITCKAKYKITLDIAASLSEMLVLQTSAAKS